MFFHTREKSSSISRFFFPFFLFSLSASGFWFQHARTNVYLSLRVLIRWYLDTWHIPSENTESARTRARAHTQREREREREREWEGAGGRREGQSVYIVYICAFVLFSSRNVNRRRTSLRTSLFEMHRLLLFTIFSPIRESHLLSSRDRPNGTLSSRVSQCSVQRASPAVLSQQSFLVFIAAVPPVDASYPIAPSNLGRSMFLFRVRKLATFTERTFNTVTFRASNF